MYIHTHTHTHIPFFYILYIYIYIYIYKESKIISCCSVYKKAYKQNSGKLVVFPRTQVAYIENKENQSSCFGQEWLIYGKCNVKHVTA